MLSLVVLEDLYFILDCKIWGQLADALGNNVKGRSTQVQWFMGRSQVEPIEPSNLSCTPDVATNAFKRCIELQGRKDDLLIPGSQQG